MQHVLPERAPDHPALVRARRSGSGAHCCTAAALRAIVRHGSRSRWRRTADTLPSCMRRGAPSESEPAHVALHDGFEPRIEFRIGVMIEQALRPPTMMQLL